jgi:hypothetical protein
MYGSGVIGGVGGKFVDDASGTDGGQDKAPNQAGSVKDTLPS